MEYNETLQMADKILFELVDVNNLSAYSHSYVNGRFSINNQTPESTYVLSALRRLSDDGYFEKKDGSSESFHINGKTLDFKNSGGYKELIKAEKRKAELKGVIEELGLKSTQSVIDTNTSIQKLNTKTDTFYTKQTKYNNVQIFLTIAILLSSAIYTTVAVVSYNESKRNSIKEQRLEELEKKLKDKTTKDSLFQKYVKDSLKLN